MTKNDKVFHQEKSYPRFVGYKFSRRTRTLILMSTTSPGELVPRYDFSRRTRTQVRLLQENSYPGTISPGEVVPNFLGTISPGYDFSWVRLLQKSVGDDTVLIRFSQYVRIFKPISSRI